MFARIQSHSRRQILLSSHSADLLMDEGIALDEVLLLQPASTGTTIRSAMDVVEIEVLRQSGLSLAEAVIPRTEPHDAQQLALFSG